MSLLPIKKEVLGQPLWSDNLKDDLVCFQGLAVDPTGQRRMEALGQPLAYCQLLGNHLIFCIVLQNLGEGLKDDARCNYKLCSRVCACAHTEINPGYSSSS